MEVLQKSRLFQGMSPEEINGVLGCMAAKEQCYEKGSFIVNQGDRMTQLYVVVKGMVHIIKSDYWGNQTIMSEAGPGEIFGEAYACAGAESQVAVRAVEDTAVYRLDVHKILTVCPSSCACHNRMITNLVSAMAQKNILLTEKIEHMSAVSSTAYTPMSLGFGVLETYTDVAPIEIDNRKFNAGDKEYCLQMIKKLHAFQDSVREVCSRLLDITECARERGDALNDLADYFADGVDRLE